MNREPARGPSIPGEPRTDEEIAPFFAGERLYGDDFDLAQLQAWYAGEAEGYASLECDYVRDGPGYVYPYTDVLRAVWYDHLPAARRFGHALSFGGAMCDELAQFTSRIDRITVIEPSQAYGRSDLNGVPVQYVKPEIDGRIPLPDGVVDLISCHGVLHHVAPVSRVVKEFARILAPNGYALIGEPTVSMGDWRFHRGLTRNERGIPLAIFDRMIAETGLTVVRRTRYNNPLTLKLAKVPLLRSMLSHPPRRHRFDRFLSTLFAFNRRYHSTSAPAKLRPASVAYVLTKPR